MPIDDDREIREIDALLGTLDHGTPPVTAEDVARRARGALPHARPGSDHRSGPGAGTGSRALSGTGPWRWAAGILLALLVAGGAYAAPGSPVPGWIDALRGRAGAGDRGGDVGTAPPGEGETGSGRDAAGLSLAPGASLVIDLRAGTGVGVAFVRARLTEESEVLVRAPAGGARFRSDPGRLGVEVLGADTVEIRIPRSAPRVEIRSGGARLLLKMGPDLSSAVEPSADGSHLLPVLSQITASFAPPSRRRPPERVPIASPAPVAVREPARFSLDGGSHDGPPRPAIEPNRDRVRRHSGAGNDPPDGDPRLR